VNMPRCGRNVRLSDTLKQAALRIAVRWLMDARDDSDCTRASPKGVFRSGSSLC
jgi:hypothetical protein